MLNENLDEIREYCQEAFENALLMSCDEKQVHEVFESIVKAIQKPYGGKKNWPPILDPGVRNSIKKIIQVCGCGT
jgi:hypothetical protein